MTTLKMVVNAIRVNMYSKELFGPWFEMIHMEKRENYKMWLKIKTVLLMFLLFYNALNEQIFF